MHRHIQLDGQEYLEVQQPLSTHACKHILRKRAYLSLKTAFFKWISANEIKHILSYTLEVVKFQVSKNMEKLKHVHVYESMKSPNDLE